MGFAESMANIASSGVESVADDYSSESSDYAASNEAVEAWTSSEDSASANDGTSFSTSSMAEAALKALDNVCENLVNKVCEETLSKILEDSARLGSQALAASAAADTSDEDLPKKVSRNGLPESTDSTAPSDFLSNIANIAQSAAAAADKLPDSSSKAADNVPGAATDMAAAALKAFGELNKDKASEAAKENSKEPVDISKMAEVRKVKNSDNSESTLYYATKEDLQKNQPTLRETATQAKKADGTLIERSVLSDMREHPPEVMSTKLTLTDKQGNTETEVVLRPDTPEAVSHKVSVNKKTNEVNYEIKEGNTSIAYRGVGDNLTTVAVDGRKLSGDEQTNSLKNGEILLSAMKKEMGSDLAKLPEVLELDKKGFKEDEKPTGRLVLDNKEYQVKDGMLTDGNRNLGKIDASGHVRLDGPPMVTLNQKGEQKFLFEGRDANDQPVVVKSENLKHQLTAEIKNPNGEVTHRISAGYLFDEKGALIGAVDERGNFKASKPETKWTHLNSKLEGSIVEGEVDGKPRHFKLDSSAPSGDIFLKNAATGKPEKHTINMGVLVNSTGDQVGLVKGPRLNNRQEIIGGSITFDSDPKNERPLASLKGAVFNLDIPGSNPIVLRGAVRNDQPALNADGKPNPSAIVDLNKLSKAIDSEHDEVAKFADRKISRFDQISKAKIDEIVKEQRSKEQILADIKNGDTASLGKVQDLIQKKIEDAKLEKATPKEKALALAEKLATQKNTLEVAPTDVKKIDGSFAYKQQDEHGKVGSATVTVRAGELFTTDNKKMGDLVNKDGVVMISVRDQDPSKPAQLVKLSDLPGVQANLKFSDRVPPESVTWIGVPGGELRSIEQLKKQAEGERELYRLTHDETFRRSTGRYGSVEVNNWKNFDDGQYSKTIAQLDAIKQNGVTSKEQFKLLDVTGISESFRPELAKQNAESSKKVIGAHPIETVEAAEKTKGDLKFPDSGKVYRIDKGMLYEVNVVDGKREVDKKPAGEIGPGYLVTLRSGEQGKPEVFNLNEKRVVVDLTFADGKRQQLIGMGKPSLNFKGELQTNGLVPREDLERQAKDYIASTSKVINEYDDKTNVINRLTENAGGFRNALVAQRDSVKTDANLLNRNLDNLFDFKPGIDSDSTNKFDNSVRFTQDLMTSMGVTTRTTELDAQGYEQARQQVAEGVVSGCITVASLGTSSALTFGASLLKAAEISKTTVALASLTGSVWTGGEISAALLSSKAMDADSARAKGQCEGAANSVSKFFEGVGPLTAIRDTKAAIAAQRAGESLSAAQQAIIQNKTLVYNLLDKGVSDKAVYLVAAVSEVGDNALQVKFGAMAQEAATGKPSTSNEAFSTAVQLITGKTSHGLIDAVPGNMTLVKSTLEQSAQGFKQSLTEESFAQLSNQRDEQKRELAQRLGIKESEVSNEFIALNYGEALRESLEQAKWAAGTAAALSPFTHAVGSLTEHSRNGKNQKETSPSDGVDTNSNAKAMYVVLNDSNSSIPAIRETAKETSVLNPEVVKAERNSQSNSSDMIVNANGNKREVSIDSKNYRLEERENGHWLYGAPEEGNEHVGRKDSPIKTVVSAKDLAESISLQTLLIPALYDNPILHADVSGFKTIDPLDHAALAKQANDGNAVFVIYSGNPEAAKKAAATIDRLLVESGFNTPLNFSPDAHIGSSGLVGLVRESFFSGVTVSGEKGVRLDPVMQAAIHEKVSLGDRLNSDQLQQIERNCGIKPDTLGYDRFGNLVLIQEDRTALAPGYLSRGNQTDGQLTDRAAMKALVQKFQVDPLQDLSYPNSYVVRNKSFKVQVEQRIDGPSSISLASEIDGSILAQARRQPSGEWLAQAGNIELASSWSGKISYENGKLDIKPASGEKSADPFVFLVRGKEPGQFKFAESDSGDSGSVSSPRDRVTEISKPGKESPVEATVNGNKENTEQKLALKSKVDSILESSNTRDKSESNTDSKPDSKPESKRDSKGNEIGKEFPEYSPQEFERTRPKILDDLKKWTTLEGSNIGEKFEALTDKLCFSPKEKNKILDGLIAVREHGARMREIDPDQKTNFEHTQREMGAVLDYAERNGFSKEQTQDLLFAAMFSDGLKTKFNFTTHNADGALALEHFASTHLKDIPADRLAVIKQSILEHQLAPPEFMAMIYSGGIVASIKKEGREMTVAEAAALKTLKEKISNPFALTADQLVDVPGPPGAKGAKLTELEQSLLRRTGLDNWYVPNEGNAWNKTSRGLIDCDGIDNYFGPGGLAKIILLRADWGDKHVVFSNPDNKAEFSSVQSWKDSGLDFSGKKTEGKLGVATPETLEYTAKLNQSMEKIIDSSRARVNDWIASAKGREELGLPAQGEIGKIPGWSGTKEHPDLIDSKTATPEDIARLKKIRAAFAEELLLNQRVGMEKTPPYEPLMRNAEERAALHLSSEAQAVKSGKEKPSGDQVRDNVATQKSEGKPNNAFGLLDLEAKRMSFALAFEKGLVPAELLNDLPKGVIVNPELVTRTERSLSNELENKSATELDAILKRAGMISKADYDSANGFVSDTSKKGIQRADQEAEFRKFVNLLESKPVKYVEYRHEQTGTSILIRAEDAFHLEDLRLMRKASEEKDPAAIVFAEVLKDVVTVPDVVAALDRKIGPASSIQEIRLTGVSDPNNVFQKFHFDQGKTLASADMINKIVRINKEESRSDFLENTFDHENAHILHDPFYVGSKHEAIEKAYDLYMKSGANSFDDLRRYGLKNVEEWTAVSLGEQLPHIPPAQFKEIINRAIHFNDDSNAALRLAVMANVAEHLLVEPLNSHFFRGESSLLPAINHLTLLENIRNTREMIYPVVAEKIMSKINDSSVSNEEKHSWGIMASEIIGRSIRPQLERTASSMNLTELNETGILQQISKLGSLDSKFWSSTSNRLEDFAFGESATKESRRTVFEILEEYDVPSHIKADLYSKEFSRLDESRAQFKLSGWLISPYVSEKESAISIFESGQFTERWKAENLVFGPGLADRAISTAPAERRAELLQTIMRGLDDRPDLQEAVLKNFENRFFVDGKKLPSQVMERYKEQIKANELWNTYEKAAAGHNDEQLGAAMLDLLAEGLPIIKPDHMSYSSAELNRELGIKEADHQYKKLAIKSNLAERISSLDSLEFSSIKPSSESKSKVEQRIEDARRDLSEFVVGIRDNKPVTLFDLLKKFDVVSGTADSRIEHLSQLRANTIKKGGIEAWHEVMNNFAEVMYPNFDKSSAPNKTILETSKLAKTVAEPARLEVPEKSLQEQLREHFSKSGSLGLNGVPDPREYSLREGGKAKPNWKRTESGEIFENTDGSRVLLPTKFDSVSKQIVLDGSKSEVIVSKERVVEIESVFKQFHGGYVNNGMVITARSASELEKELNVPRNTIFDFSERHRNFVEVGSGDSDVIARIRQAREVAQKIDPLAPGPDNAIGFDLIPNEKGAIYQADATKPLPLPENSVDGIITAYSLLSPLGMQRYPERQQSAFDNMIRVLKSGTFDEGGVQNGGELLVGPIIREDLDRMVSRSPFKLEVEPVPLAKADGSAVIQTFIVKKGLLKEDHESLARTIATQSREVSQSDVSHLAQLRAAREQQNGRPGMKNEHGDEVNQIQRDGLILNDRVEEIPGLSRVENTVVDQVFLRPEFSGQDRSAVNKALADFGLYRTTDAAEMQKQTDKFFTEATYVHPMEQITYLTEQGNKIYVPVEMEGWLSGIRDSRERAKLDPSNEALQAEVQRDSYAILPEDVARFVKSGLGSENLKEIYLYSGADPKDAFTNFHSDEETLNYASANAATGQVWLNDALWANNLESYLNHELGHFSKSPQTATGESSLEAARVLEGHGEIRTIVDPYEHVVSGLEGEAYPVIGREGIETMPPRKFMQAVDSLLVNPELSNTDIKLVVLADQLRREIDNKTWSTHSETGKLSMAPDVDQMRANVNLAYIEKVVYPTVENKLAYIIAHADYETYGRPEAMVIAKSMGRSSLIERLNVELGSMASDDPYRPKLIEAISELTPMFAKEYSPATAESMWNSSEPKLGLEQMLSASDSEMHNRLLEAIISPNHSDEYNRDALSLAKVVGGPSLVTELQKRIDAMPLEEFANNPRLLASIAELSRHEFIVDSMQAEFDASLDRTAEVMKQQIGVLKQGFGDGIDLSYTRNFIERLEATAGLSVDGLENRLGNIQRTQDESAARTVELERRGAEAGYPWSKLNTSELSLNELVAIRKQVNDRLQKTLSVSDDPWGQLVKNAELGDYLLPGLRKPEDVWTEVLRSAENKQGLSLDDLLQAREKVGEQLKKLQSVDSWDAIVRKAEELKYGFPDLDLDVVGSKGLLQAVIDRWEKNLGSSVFDEHNE